MERMNRIGSKWTEQDRSGQNRTNVDRIGPMWTESDQSELNNTKWTELNFSGHNGLNRTEQDGPNRTNEEQIRLLNIYNFYCIFRAHIFNF